jgi:hypothetical protein
MSKLFGEEADPRVSLMVESHLWLREDTEQIVPRSEEEGLGGRAAIYGRASIPRVEERPFMAA